MKDAAKGFVIDYVEIYTPMAKVMSYWHTHALGFSVSARSEGDPLRPGVTSYVLESHDIRLVLTSAYPTSKFAADREVASFVAQSHYGVKRIALRVPSVRQAFENAISNGAIPLKLPVVIKDDNGSVEEAAIRLYDNSEIVFIDRNSYSGVFKPGYSPVEPARDIRSRYFLSIDHIAAEVRMNECAYWTRYLTGAIGTSLVQRINSGEENKTGMILNVNQSADQYLTFVIAEPESHLQTSRVQQNIDTFGPGIHHLAFTTGNLADTVRELEQQKVEFVKFPDSYYDLLRNMDEYKDMDINSLQRNGIIVDKEDDTFLLQKFIKPISDRPFFIYEIVQRVNGYRGFALKNINVLKRSEEIQIMNNAMS